MIDASLQVKMCSSISKIYSILNGIYVHLVKLYSFIVVYRLS
jgi:hypothetical protein